MTGQRQLDEVRQSVRERYAEVVRRHASNCCAAEPSCCGEPSCCAETMLTDEAYAQVVGYSAEELQGVPEGANMSLGCGNPQAIAALRPGEVVLDLGSGGGLDCFLAARQVGPGGHVIGVDMTPQMVSKARANADAAGTSNVEFRLGEIEHLPVADGVADVILSNCVINLSPDKPQVFREAYRALKPGGRLAISDVVATAPIPQELRENEELWSNCVAGAEEIGRIKDILGKIGFRDIRISPKDESREFIREWVPGTGITDYVVSATIEAVK